MTDFRWAKTEKEAAELQADGWKLAPQRLVHHHHWALLLARPADYRDKEGE